MLAEKKELLKRALLEARLNEYETIPSTESLEQEHVFSLSFEKKMKAITSRNKISTIIKKAGKYVAGFSVICVLTGSAFLVMQGGDLFFGKFVSNDMAMEGVVEDAENAFSDTLAAEEYEADEENYGEEEEEDKFPQETVVTGSSIGGISADIISNIYEENGNMVIELNYADSEVLSQGIIESFITFSKDVTGSGTNDSPDYNYSDSLTTDSSLSGTKLDEELYDVIEEDKLVRYVIDSEQVKEFSRLNIYLQTDSDTVKLSFMVNEADGSLSLIE